MAKKRDDTVCNEVRLVGKVSSRAAERTLPSGDQLTTFRVVVTRPPRRAGRAARSPTVDAIDVACFSAATRRRAATLSDGDPIEVRGALRRRFFRTASGPQSRYDVEAVSLKRPTAE